MRMEKGKETSHTEISSEGQPPLLRDRARGGK